MYIIKLSDSIEYNTPVYLSDNTAATLFPERTYFTYLAKKYKTKSMAEHALTKARKTQNKTYIDAEILEV